MCFPLPGFEEGFSDMAIVASGNGKLLCFFGRVEEARKSPSHCGASYQNFRT